MSFIFGIWYEYIADDDFIWLEREEKKQID